MDHFITLVVTYYKNLIYQNRRWVFFIIAIFLVGTLAGILISNTAPFITSSVIGQYSSSLNLSLKDFNLSLFIFQRNVSIVGTATLLGVFLGVVPVFIAFLNGILLGLIVGFPALYKAVNPVQLFFLLFPHGIFEYTATFLALAFGLRLGVNWLLPGSFGRRLKTLRVNIVQTFYILVLALILLIVAALIEGMLTGRIACFFTGVCR